MKRILTVMLGLLAALGLTLGLTTTATAAPKAKYTSSTQSGLLQLGTTLGLFTITGFGGTEYDAATGTITAPVTNNVEASQKVIQHGGITLAKADGSSLTIEAIKYDIKAGLVSGVINDERVNLYVAEQTSDTTATLTVHPEGGAILRQFVNLFGIPADGSVFGTSSLS
ncbi:hypothetical protein N802_00620 [Knoellia sinensis KCTC 19936]|uniref:Uncharacterized protein n=1 Tax=Knoellia sinensis KCTC 19936 TaxID=1385520 RepID=A0A0A0JDY5_9MICO|nr:hypothetical protein [Knoellia sinensis]KGN34989.1 hypothetical protein N802_00620 [Knoellia sinensis KCTC 19936]